MKKIHAAKIADVVKKLIISSNYELGIDVLAALKSALKSETSKIAREILADIIENARIAKTEGIPICQDTGMAVVFVELGQDARIVSGDLYEAIQEGIREGSKKGYLRKSIVGDPLIRENTKDNAPAVIHVEVVPGSRLKIIVYPKGAGSENMSRVAVLKPSQGIEGIKNFILDTVKKAGGNCCPPGVIGVGLGGTVEKAALLSKKTLLRRIGGKSRFKHIARLEKELLNAVNKLKIGPMGLGGKTTALAVHIETYPCHIASLPIAVNMGCHAHRHKEIIL